MLRTSRVFCLPCLALLAAALDAAVVRGVVCDIHGRALAGVRVLVDSHSLELRTGSDGRFAFEAGTNEPSLQLTFEAPGYHREKRQVRFPQPGRLLQVYLIPSRLLKEDVTVTALMDVQGERAAPAAQQVVAAAAIQESRPETVVQAIQGAPGVHFIGKGGIAVTPSIRGLARRRVLLLVDGARITSDRSAGSSAHFFPAEMVDRIEVVRSAASVLYGSDAMGGVIQVLPRSTAPPPARPLALNFSGHALDGRRSGGFSYAKRFGRLDLAAAFQAARAGDYSAGGEKVLRSGYRYASGDLAVGYESPARSLRLAFFQSAGRDVGKPERANNPDISSWYPREDIRLFTLGYVDRGLISKGQLHAAFFFGVNGYELNKHKAGDAKLEITRNAASDFGFRLALKKEPPGRLAYQVGVDYFGRAGVDMESETWKNGQLVDAAAPVRNGRRADAGVYALLTLQAPAGIELAGGARLGAFSRSALSAGGAQEKSTRAPALFLGATKRLDRGWSAFASIGTAFRMPSLSEAFYTGITGRSFIVGNPGLRPEKSLNLDAGVRFQQRRAFIGFYLFQNTIRGMIEKYPLPGDAYTYDNITRGRIRGVELECRLRPLDPLELFASAFCCQGIDQDGRQPLNDVPSARAFLGARLWLGRFWGELDWQGAAAQRRPGPAEVVVAGSGIVDLKAGFYLSGRLFLFIKAANLFDRAYYANADPDIPLARGRDVALGLNINL